MTNTIIKTHTGLQRVSLLMQELNMSSSLDTNIHVRLGYRDLTAQDKETYYLLKKISTQQNEQLHCSVRLDYLATIFNTTSDCQKNRLLNLQKASLIKILPKDTYHICNPTYPDSTFVTALATLIRRKRLSEYIAIYKICYNPLQRLGLLYEIKKLIKKGITHKELSNLIVTANAGDVINIK